MAVLPSGWDKEIRPDAPEEQLAAAISSSGLNPAKNPRIVLDGKIHRFPVEGDKGTEKAGWYIGFGDNIPAGMFGSWRGCFEQRWRANVGRELSAEELAAYEVRIAEITAIKEAERRKYYEQIAEAVRKILDTVQPAAEDHPYLVKKRVGSYGIYETGDGRLMLPVVKDGDVVSAQYIDDDGTKQFHGGGEIKGGYFPIGPVPPQGTVYVAEGYATAASIYEATGKTTIVALNAGNMPVVAKWLRGKLGPAQEIVIVGDNDESGTGQKAAEEAAHLCGGRAVIPPETGDANDYVNAGGDLKALLKGSSSWLTAADDFCAKPAPLAWLVKKWIQRGGLAMVFGDSGCGKTFVVLDWVLRIASDVDDWAGLKVRHGGVVYLAGEGHYGLKARIAGWKQYHKVEHLNAWVSSSDCELNTTEGLAKTISEIRSLETEDISVIVVDTLHRFLVGDENKAVDAKTMLDACSMLSRTFDCSVILVHHTGANQDAKGRARGSTAWRGALDNQILVSSNGDRIKLEQVKNKDGEIAEPVYLEKIPVHLPGWYDDDGEPVSTLILEPDEDGAEKETTKLTKSQHFGLQTYREAAEKYGVLDERGEFAGVNVEDWREVFYEQCEDVKQESKKKRFQRARNELIELGELNCYGEIYQLSEDYELEKVYISKSLRNRDKGTGRDK